MIPVNPTGAFHTMDSLPTWAWWMIVAGLLFSATLRTAGLRLWDEENQRLIPISELRF